MTWRYPTGKVTEWRSKALPRYQRLTKKAEALIAAVYLACTNTRCVKRALFGLFEGAVSKDVVSRAWRKVKVDWDAWCFRSRADEDIVRLILDGTVIKTRIDKKATNISVLAAIGVRRDTKDGRYSNASDYVRDLIRRDQDRHRAIAELQQLVDEGIASGPARHLDVEAFLARKRDQNADTKGH